jgi:hypothetical protein
VPLVFIVLQSGFGIGDQAFVIFFAFLRSCDGPSALHFSGIITLAKSGPFGNI